MASRVGFEMAIPTETALEILESFSVLSQDGFLHEADWICSGTTLYAAGR
jgi:hypothetical protein